jgi:hypothetical protein
MAVWLFCSAVFVFVSVIYIASEWLLPAAGGAWSGQKIPVVATQLGAFLIPLATGLVLFLFAPRLARLICKDVEPESSPVEVVAWGAGDAYRIGSFLMGVYVFVRAIGQAVNGTVQLASRDGLSTNSLAMLVEAAILAALGTALVFGSRGLAKFLHSLGYDPHDVPAQQFSLRLFLILIVGCSILMLVIRSWMN